MSDLISRQAAIDAVLDRMDTEKHGRNAKPEEIKWTLERVPSAQPEIIRCGKCTHKDKKIDYCHRLGITICECDYCSFAERRTDGSD